jgi:hypothetical protein
MRGRGRPIGSKGTRRVPFLPLASVAAFALLVLPPSAGAAPHETLKGNLPEGGSVTVKVRFAAERHYQVTFDRLSLHCADGSRRRLSFEGGMTIGTIAKDKRHFGLGAQSSGYFGWGFDGRLKRRALAVGTVVAHATEQHDESVRCKSSRVHWRAVK